jgi:hypothetical protein
LLHLNVLVNFSHTFYMQFVSQNLQLGFVYLIYFWSLIVAVSNFCPLLHPFTDSVALIKFSIKIIAYVSGSGSQWCIGMDDVSSYLTEPKFLHTYIMHSARPQMYASHCYLSMESRELIIYVDISVARYRSVCAFIWSRPLLNNMSTGLLRRGNLLKLVTSFTAAVFRIQGFVRCCARDVCTDPGTSRHHI